MKMAVAKRRKRSPVTVPECWYRVDYKYKFGKNWMYSFVFIKCWKDKDLQLPALQLKRQLKEYLDTFTIVSVMDATCIAGKT